ncbi:MAG: hypothetical protein ACRCXT_09155 [Paraclostridium sp.]
MLIEELDLETRSKIYNHTKKILRKYQKGITTGKLTADKFANNILEEDNISSIINTSIISDQEFYSSYVSYIETLIKKQNETVNMSKRKKSNQDSPSNSTINISQKLKLKNLLSEYGYELTMPIQYLNPIDMNNIIQFISTGEIELGNERIYKYVHKIKKH